MENTFNDGLAEGMEDQLMSLLSADDASVKLALESGQISALTESFYDRRAVQKQIKEFKEDNVSKNEVYERVVEYREMVGDMAAAMAEGFEEGSPKDQLIHALLMPSIDFLQAVYDGYDQADCEIEIELFDGGQLPARAHPHDAGMDVYANGQTNVNPHMTYMINTGFKVAIPEGWQLSVRPRSGLSAKTALRIANAPGTIDTGFHDEVKIIVENTGDDIISIEKGDRIAQLVLERVYKVTWKQVDSLSVTDSRTNDKGEQGFGSTGA